jgi:microcystin-dependent protein
MADNVTANYGWVQPEVGASATTWGTKLNSDLALIDAQVFTNQAATNTAMAAMVPIGGVVDYIGTTAPANYLMCDGSQHSTATYPTLSGLLGGSGGTFNVPDLRDRVTVGAGVSYSNKTTGGEATHVLTIGEVAAHAHGVNDPQHYHNVNDNTHTHGLNADSHTHGASQPAHAHGGVAVGLTGPGTGSIAGGVGGGNLAMGNTAAAQPGVTVNPAASGIQIAANWTGIANTQYTPTNISIQNNGGGAAHNNMQPFYALNKIIRAL